MARELTVSSSQIPTLGSVELRLPTLITQDGEHTTRRFIEFFTATIRNANTREAIRFLLFANKQE